MAYRFVHTADIHLDSPLRSLALHDPDLAELISNATRHAFVRVVDLCLDEQVDAVLLAGDLYDGDQTSMKTAQLRRLDDAGMGASGYCTLQYSPRVSGSPTGRGHG